MLPRAALAIGAAAAAAALLARRDRLPRPGALALAGLAVAVAAGAAAAASAAPALALAGAYGRYDSLPVRLAYLGLFAGGALLPASAAARRRAVDWFCVAVAIASLEAVLQWAAGPGFRPDGNLGQPGLLGGLAALAAAPSLERARRDRRWLASLAALACGIAVAGSRAGALGAVTACALLPVVRAPGRRWAVAAAAAAAVIGASALAIALSPLRTLNGDSGSARLHLWRDGIDLIASRPWLGFGEDATGIVLGRFLRGDYEGGAAFDRLHSAPLDLAATQGLAGAGAAAAFWLLWLRGVRRHRGNPSVAEIVAATGGLFAWSILSFDWVAVTGPLWLLAGVAYGWTLEGGAGFSGAPRRRSFRRAAGAGAAIVVVAAAGLPVAADAAGSAGNTSLARTLDPLQPRYHRGSIAELERAVALGDYDPAVFRDLSDRLRAAGRNEEARAVVRRGLLIAPFDPGLRSRDDGPGPYSSSSNPK